MAEPILTYKKGEGWVYQTHQVAYGKFLEFHQRPPNPGEHFTWLRRGQDDEWFIDDTTINMDMVLKWWGDHTLQYFGPYPSNFEVVPGRAYITVVPRG